MSPSPERLYYYCAKRGTKENELLLRRFADQYLKTLSSEDLEALEAFLACSDEDIFKWIMNPKTVPESHNTRVFSLIVKSAKG